jgi:thiamine pyrophosphate-dependent acetolactate synthase large subunit-like protein
MVEKVAKVIIDTLEAAGVKNCYGIGGDVTPVSHPAITRVLG